MQRLEPDEDERSDSKSEKDHPVRGFPFPRLTRQKENRPQYEAEEKGPELDRVIEHQVLQYFRQREDRSDQAQPQRDEEWERNTSPQALEIALQ